MNNQKNRQIKTTISLLARLMVVSCWLVGSATPLLATEELITQPPAAAVDSSGTAAEQSCEFFSSPQRYNTWYIGADGREIEPFEGATADTTIVIGPQPNRPYQVIIPGGDAASLHILRTCILDAFISQQARFGPYIHIGSFGRRNEAEGLTRILIREGYPARVIYRR